MYTYTLQMSKSVLRIDHPTMPASTVIVIFVCNLLLALPAFSSQDISWPNGARVAVSLSYDDALDSQLDHAVPSLDEHGFKASFYLTLT